MFQKKQVIYSESLGACVVDNIVALTASRTEPAVQYYVLKSLFEDKVSYIPVQNHQVKLREMFSVQEAKDMLDSKEAKEDAHLMAAIKYVLDTIKQED